jgi:hypothetical protein
VLCVEASNAYTTPCAKKSAKFKNSLPTHSKKLMLLMLPVNFNGGTAAWKSKSFVFCFH